jgi:thiamine-phosphate diphosphorylase
MRPLPRLLAFTDDRIASRDDFDLRATAMVASGPAVGLVARMPAANADTLAEFALRCVALSRATEAAVLVTGRVDVAMAAGANGVILRSRDLGVSDVRAAIAAAGAEMKTLVLCSVHAEDEADIAVRQGVDGLIVGSIWASASHPDRPGAGLDLLQRVVALGVPTYAIGGVTAVRAAEARDAGAWGVAAISALWDAADTDAAACAMLAPWQTMTEGAVACS